MSDCAGGLVGGTIIHLIGLTFIYNGLKMLLLRQKIMNTPTSKVESAAVGFVELAGKAKCKDDFFSPVDGAKCAYCELDIEDSVYRKHGSGWKNIISRESGNQFYLEDKTGKMLIDSNNAEMDIPDDIIYLGVMDTRKIGPRVKSLMSRDHEIGVLLGSYSGHTIRIQERRIEDGKQLYVLGNAQPIPGAESSAGQENLIVKDGGGEKLFYISDSDEKRILQKYTQGDIIKNMLIGLAVIIGSLLFLAKSLEII
jgi:hypothetical protein